MERVSATALAVSKSVLVILHGPFDSNVCYRRHLSGRSFDLEAMVYGACDFPPESRLLLGQRGKVAHHPAGNPQASNSSVMVRFGFLMYWDFGATNDLLPDKYYLPRGPQLA